MIHSQVPRMLFDNISELENYVLKSKDKGLLAWWARYLESTGEMDTALQFYQVYTALPLVTGCVT